MHDATLDGGARAEAAADQLEAALALFDQNDMGNAARLIARYKDDLRAVVSGKSVDHYVWDGTRYAVSTRGEARQLAHKVVAAIREHEVPTLGDPAARTLDAWARASGMSPRISAMLLEAAHRPEVAAAPADFDRDPGLLNCLNGTLDLRSGTLRPHSRADALSKRIDVEYDPDAPRPLWEKVLSDVFPDPAVRAYWKRACGAALDGDVGCDKLHVCHGGGENGKSTVLAVLHDVLGEYAWAAKNDFLLTSAADDGNMTAMLVGRRFVSCVETSATSSLDEARVKHLTGKDRVTCRRNYRDPFEFMPTHHFFLATNNLPLVKGTDHAIWRRLVVVPFEAKIRNGDPRIREKLRAEHAGILAWMVEGLAEYGKVGHVVPARIDDLTAEYRVEQDLVGGFLAAVTEPASGVDRGVPASRLYKVFRGWCEARGERCPSARLFGMKLTDRGLPKRKSGGVVLYDVRLTPAANEYLGPRDVHVYVPPPPTPGLTRTTA